MADAATPENYQVVRLQIWARQWNAAKLAPRRYGEQSETTLKIEYLEAEKRALMRAELIRRLDLKAVPEPLTIEGKAGEDTARDATSRRASLSVVAGGNDPTLERTGTRKIVGSRRQRG